MTTLSILLFTYASLFFFISLIIKKICIVDVAWALGFFVVVIQSLFHVKDNVLNLNHVVLFLMVSIWSLRLATYLFFRMRNKPDDWRYLELKKGWGENWKLQSYLKVFLFQSFLLFLCSSTLWYGTTHLPIEWGVLQSLGLIFWFFGFGLESYADSYLKKFKSNPNNKGHFCQTGPWKYCRYPNYLGEITLWFGIYLFVLNTQTWWTIFSPILLMMLILKFSGLPYLEKNMIKYPGYLEYKNKVPTLIPFTKFF